MNLLNMLSHFNTKYLLWHKRFDENLAVVIFLFTQRSLLGLKINGISNLHRDRVLS